MEARLLALMKEYEIDPTHFTQVDPNRASKLIPEIKKDFGPYGGLTEERFERVTKSGRLSFEGEIAYFRDSAIVSPDTLVMLNLDTFLQDYLLLCRWDYLPVLWEKMWFGDHSVLAIDCSWHLLVWHDGEGIEVGYR